jgi:hypothetical protein
MSAWITKGKGLQRKNRTRRKYLLASDQEGITDPDVTESSYYASEFSSDNTVLLVTVYYT